MISPTGTGGFKSATDRWRGLTRVLVSKARKSIKRGSALAAAAGWGLGAVMAGAAEEPEIVSRSGWDALEARPYADQVPERFTIHHSAVQLDSDADYAGHLRNIQVWGMGAARNWSDIPYHFILDPEGVVYEGRHPGTKGESNTDYEIEAHLQINLMGDFNEHPVPEKQFEALVAFLAWCSGEFEIAPETIRAHRDFAPTACPGEHLYEYVKSGVLREAVEASIAKEN